MKVCVIAGIAAAKDFLDYGFEVVVYDCGAEVGGNELMAKIF